MSTRRTSRSDRLGNTDHLLGVLGTCRTEVIRATATVKAFGPVYHALSMVVSAIDALATLLTGQPYHFSIGGSVATDQQRAEALDAEVSSRDPDAGADNPR